MGKWHLAPFALVGQVGVTIAVTIVVGVLLGLWVDGAVGTRPWGLLVCMLAGVAAGTFGVYRQVAAAIDLIDRQRVDDAASQRQDERGD